MAAVFERSVEDCWPKCGGGERGVSAGEVALGGAVTEPGRDGPSLCRNEDVEDERLEYGKIEDVPEGDT